MNEHTLAIVLVSLAAVLIVGYTVYRTIQSNQLRKRLEDEAWQRHIGKPIPWEYKTRQKTLYRQQVGRTKRGGK